MKTLLYIAIALVSFNIAFAQNSGNPIASLDIYGIGDNGEMIENPKIEIEEQITFRMQPLLNYIFFEENSFELPERYTKLTDKESQIFAIDQLYRYNTLSTYRQILNIIGLRLRNSPRSKITITGCNANIGSERNDLELSQKRALAVKEYLMNVWNIQSNRLILKSRNLPAKPSTTENLDDRNAENRRVEITSSNLELMKPIISTDTILISTPKKLRFIPRVDPNFNLGTWEIKAQNARWTQQIIPGKNTRIPNHLDWELSANLTTIPEKGKLLNCYLFVQDKENESNYFKTKTRFVNVEYTLNNKLQSKRILDKEVTKFTLILFDFDRADINPQHKQTIEWIKDINVIKDWSKVDILGFTDRSGDAKHNLNLSEDRASIVNRELRAKNSKMQGMGKQMLLYDNDYPEGRYYCRTVTITVETELR